ncbi:hypothetical protein F5X97DRAFT_108516 [Nemania serpens]|nr:hypothetical protein F5X97DRAFT_108516 [Nemania serpens]
MVYVRPKKGTRRGPKPFTGSRRKRCDLRVPPVKPVVRPIVHHPRQLKIDVLHWLINNRVAITEATEHGNPWLASASATRKSQKVLTDDERRALRQAFHKNGAIYRPPTFVEAGLAWKLGTATIVHWWEHRERWLSPEDFERSNNLLVYEIAPGAGIPEPDPEPAPEQQVVPEDGAVTDNVDAPEDENNHDDHNDDSDDDDVVELPPPSAIELSDTSDSEIDDDDSELPDLEAALDEELAAEARQARMAAAEGGRDPQDLENDDSDDDIDDDDIDDDDADGEDADD